MTHNLKGSVVAIVTPMLDDGSLDLNAYRQLIDWHIASGTAAIVAVGTTGESATVDVEEHLKLIEVAVRHVAGRVPVIAGTGGNSTAEAISLTREAARLGAQYTLQVAPYYNKPTQEGMFRHFCAVAEQGGLPVLLYNVPSRTVADIANETVLRLTKVPNIVGIKDSIGQAGRSAALLAALPDGFMHFSGNDDDALALMALGSHGVISVTANVAPALMAQMCAAALAGDFAKARRINQQLIPLHGALFVETNPSPVKWALHRMGRIGLGIRLPLVALSEAGCPAVEQALAASGVLSAGGAA